MSPRTLNWQPKRAPAVEVHISTVSFSSLVAGDTFAAGSTTHTQVPQLPTVQPKSCGAPDSSQNSMKFLPLAHS